MILAQIHSPTAVMAAFSGNVLKLSEALRKTVQYLINIIICLKRMPNNEILISP